MTTAANRILKMNSVQIFFPGQYMYTLCWYEKRGKELMAAGVTEKNFADSADVDEMDGR